MNKLIVTTIIMITCIMSAKADYQNAVINDIWGGEKLVPFVFLHNLTFSENSMTVNYLGDSTKVYDYDNIQKIYFRTTTSDVKDSYADSEYSVFPNPSSDYISIDSPCEYPFNADIYGISGNKILTVTLYSAGDKINISSLQTGTYFIKLYNKILKFEKYEN